MQQYDIRVDDYIAKSAEFARPVLEYIRQVVHEASPLVSETIKWGFPFFDYKGPVCQMAAFKHHLALGFWRASLLNDPDHKLRIGDQNAGSFGRLTSIADLPSKEILTEFVLQAVTLNEGGRFPIKRVVKEKGILIIPDYFIDFISQHPKANEVFEKFPPSHKREYIEWIVEAKTDSTRLKRMESAMEMISEGSRGIGSISGNPLTP